MTTAHASNPRCCIWSLAYGIWYGSRTTAWCSSVGYGHGDIAMALQYGDVKAQKISLSRSQSGACVPQVGTMVPGQIQKSTLSYPFNRYFWPESLTWQRRSQLVRHCPNQAYRTSLESPDHKEHDSASFCRLFEKLHFSKAPGT